MMASTRRDYVWAFHHPKATVLLMLNEVRGRYVRHQVV